MTHVVGPKAFFQSLRSISSPVATFTPLSISSLTNLFSLSIAASTSADDNQAMFDPENVDEVGDCSGELEKPEEEDEDAFEKIDFEEMPDIANLLRLWRVDGVDGRDELEGKQVR